jgi:hypothetical protein
MKDPQGAPMEQGCLANSRAITEKVLKREYAAINLTFLYTDSCESALATARTKNKAFAAAEQTHCTAVGGEFTEGSITDTTSCDNPVYQYGGFQYGINGSIRQPFECKYKIYVGESDGTKACRVLHGDQNYLGIYPHSIGGSGSSRESQSAAATAARQKADKYRGEVQAECQAMKEGKLHPYPEYAYSYSYTDSNGPSYNHVIQQTAVCCYKR